jgi:hypothetical protein
MSKADALLFMKRMVKPGRIDLRQSSVYLDPPYLEKARRLYPLYFNVEIGEHVIPEAWD